jgi:hypothetical protein
MAKGRKKKPDNVKVLHGTFRDDRANHEAPVPDSDLPRSPDWLSPEAREHFGVLKERLDSVGLASRTFTEAHAIAAQRMADMIELRQLAVESGWDKSISTRYENAVKDVKSALGDLGLNQVSISKTKQPDKGEDRQKRTGFGGL